MMRKELLAILVSAFVVLMVWSAEPFPSQEEAVGQINHLGGSVEIDRNTPGQPVFTVSLARTPVTDKELAFLKALPTLTHLELFSTKIGDKGLASLGSMSSLTRLSLTGTRVGDKGLANLKEIEIHSV